MWRIEHKCHVAGELMDYASIKTEYSGMKLTRMICLKCRETLYLVGHEPWDQAVPLEGEKGFAILATHREN